MRIIVDIDTALVVRSPSGRPHTLPEGVEAVKLRMAAGDKVTLWSSRGLRFARLFARDNGLQGARCMRKPDAIVAHF